MSSRAQRLPLGAVYHVNGNSDFGHARRAVLLDYLPQPKRTTGIFRANKGSPRRRSYVFSTLISQISPPEAYFG
jgi:hypothetical protein